MAKAFFLEGSRDAIETRIFISHVVGWCGLQEAKLGPSFSCVVEGRNYAATVYFRVGDAVESCGMALADLSRNYSAIGCNMMDLIEAWFRPALDRFLDRATAPAGGAQ